MTHLHTKNAYASVSPTSSMRRWRGLFLSVIALVVGWGMSGEVWAANTIPYVTMFSPDSAFVQSGTSTMLRFSVAPGDYPTGSLKCRIDVRNNPNPSGPFGVSIFAYPTCNTGAAQYSISTGNLTKDKVFSLIVWSDTNIGTAGAAMPWDTTVSIATAPTFNFSVNGTSGTTSNYPTVTINSGQNLNLVWNNVANATSCTGTGTNWSGTKSTGGGNDTLTNVTTSALYTLSCQGSGGTVAKSVQVNVNAASAVNGACGSADGRTFSSPGPTTNLCSPGTPSSVTTNTNSFTWSCNGSNGGSNASCSANKTASSAISGTCGAAATNYPSSATSFSGPLCGNGSGVTNPATVNFPSQGNSVNWTCGGSNGGASSGTCTAIHDANFAVNGACGSAHNHTFAASDTAYGSFAQCSNGSSSNTTFPAQGATVTWVCNGSSGGSNSGNCSASRSAGASSPTVSITATPNPVNSGSSTLLSWSTTNASSCTLNGGQFSNLSVNCNDNRNTNPITSNTTYTLIASGAGGTTSGSVTVTIMNTPPPPPPSCGGAVTVARNRQVTGSANGDVWGSGPYTNDSSLSTASVHAGLLAVGQTGVIHIADAGCVSSFTGSTRNGVTTRSYSNPYQAMSITLTTDPTAPVEPTASITATPNPVEFDMPTLLTWSSSGATTCNLIGGEYMNKPVDCNGSITTNALRRNVSYTLFAVGAGGTARASVFVPIHVGATIAFTADPKTVAFGEKTTLTISSFRMSTCSLEGGQFVTPQLVSCNGSITTEKLMANTTYYLTAYDVVDQRYYLMQSVLVDRGDITLNFTVNGDSLTSTTILAGQSATLHWSVSEPSICIADGNWNGLKRPDINQTESTGILAVTGMYEYKLSCIGDGHRSTGVKSVRVNVTCSPGACHANNGKNPADICLGTTVQGTDSCGTCTIQGTRNCNVDWTEVAP